MWNIIIGAVFIIGALSGQLVLIGTHSSLGLGILGAGLVVWGITQVSRRKS
jgi:hypothetical protein